MHISRPQPHPSEAHAGDTTAVAAAAAASCARLCAPPAAAYSACTLASALMWTLHPGEQKCIAIGLTGLLFASYGWKKSRLTWTSQQFMLGREKCAYRLTFVSSVAKERGSTSGGAAFGATCNARQFRTCSKRISSVKPEGI